ncbi:hypothetical protein D9756_001171 [Leucocoprinus leucothites]|uniref:Uncharacterized protein n=1 Tax=Leucocoprinus leucothites TaxID=201217 RepID=A0A8H5LHY7_9AGAR|nr:hypothetical protein D9756_001171 [Leucoagaricus leucothites]
MAANSPMVNLPLTPKGISKLLQLTGKIYETNIVAQILIPTWPDYELFESMDPPVPYSKTLEVVVSDGDNYTEAIISVERDELLRPFEELALIRIRKAISCCIGMTWQLILEDPELLSTQETVLGKPFSGRPKIQNATGNPVPIAALKHFKDNEIPPLRALVTYKSRLIDPRDLPIRTFFIVHLLDESSEISAFAEDCVALELYHRLILGKVYYFSGFRHR